VEEKRKKGRGVLESSKKRSYTWKYPIGTNIGKRHSGTGEKRKKSKREPSGKDEGPHLLLLKERR